MYELYPSTGTSVHYVHFKIKILIFGSMTLDLYFCRLKSSNWTLKITILIPSPAKTFQFTLTPLSKVFQHNQMDKFRKEVKTDIFLTPLDNACQFCTIDLKLLAPKAHQFSY